MTKEMRLAIALLAAGCAARPPMPAPSPTSPTSPPSPPSPPSPAAPKAGCPESPNAEALLAAHAQRYGSQRAVLAALPRAFHGERIFQGQSGPYERVLDRAGHRDASAVRGMPQDAAGMDASGPWEIQAGVVVRLRRPEAVEIALEGWLARREYLSAFDPKRDSAKCVSFGGAPALVLAYQLLEIGSPELTFDLGSATLRSEVHATSVGERASKSFVGWSQPDAGGVRWPDAILEKDCFGNTGELKILSHSPGLICALPSQGSGAECLSPPPVRFRLRWPRSGAVRVPMRFDSSELVLRAFVDGRERWALLDSGVGFTAIDSTAPLGPAFKPAVEMVMGAGTQTIRVGMGEIASARIGDLIAENLPAIAAPIQALANLGSRRPEIVLGSSFFLAAAVRVDYGSKELTFAPSSDALRSPQSVPLPVALLGGRVVAEGVVDDVPAPFEIDTGAGLTLDFAETWARANGFLGERRKRSLHGVMGVGAQESTATLLRIRRLELGPIRTGSRIAGVASLPGHGRLAGILGNRALAHCRAIVFDLPHRLMWFEPPCDRPMPEDGAGWRLVPSDSAAQPSSPWVVGAVAQGSAAERAGVREGDRILELAGKPAELDVEVVDEQTRRSPGTKLELVVDRAGKRKRLQLELSALLAQRRLQPSSPASGSALANIAQPLLQGLTVLGDLGESSLEPLPGAHQVAGKR